MTTKQMPNWPQLRAEATDHMLGPRCLKITRMCWHGFEKGFVVGYELLQVSDGAAPETVARSTVWVAGNATWDSLLQAMQENLKTLGQETAIHSVVADRLMPRTISGTTIRDNRVRKGQTIRSAAAELQVHRRSVEYLENGDHMPTQRVLTALLTNGYLD